ncbi:outer membrane beta-barrel protein [Pseudaquidulcibacter saccharophilus]|uniref:outer membrane beta-barrel protein n=1 Tax=Pseudaquidulcibacter saccharophilus TaxID=2831900 RepID=UPI001EFF0D17|nr:outer membrane beta-barrel protein [Pseudaquidulcibacter saccharophilus]
MISKRLLLGSLMLATSLGFVNASYAQSSFARDRNATVSNRVPNEYAPLGIKMGGFTAFPQIAVNAAYNDNIYYLNSNKTSDSIITIKPEIRISSDWGRHSLSFLGNYGYSEYTSNSSNSFSDFKAQANGKLDIIGFDYLSGQLGYSGYGEPRGETYSVTDAAETIDVRRFNSQLSYNKEFNRLRTVFTINNDKYSFSNVKSFQGTIIDQSYRDRSEISGSIRAEYASSPSLSFFVSYEPRKISYDNNVNNLDSTSNAVYLGTSFDITDLITGEIKVGKQDQNYDNPLYGTRSSSPYSGKASWYPTRRTSVTVDFSQSTEESTVAALPGYKYTNYGIKVDYELFRNSIISVGFSNSAGDYSLIDRNDNRNSVSLDAIYRINRNYVAKFMYKYSKLDSKGANSVADYTSNVIGLGLVYAY